MSRIYLDEPIDEQYLGAIVALGNFDGVHLGHQAVIGEAVRWARSIACPCVVATFDPHPVRYFSPDADPFHLTTLDQRQELLEALGADAMLIFRFNEQLATIHADRWVERVIAHRLAARGVVTGEDFNFGKARSGNAAMLKALGGRFGISARTVAAVHESGLPVSSSRIRQAIQDGDCTTATQLLTRPYAIRGRQNQMAPGATPEPRRSTRVARDPRPNRPPYDIACIFCRSRNSRDRSGLVFPFRSLRLRIARPISQACN